MSVSVSEPDSKPAAAAAKTKPRFPKPTPAAPLPPVQPPSLTADQVGMSQFLRADVLTQMAQQKGADDERHRKLTCVVFFWTTLLALGPGGPVTLHRLMTYGLVARQMAGLPGPMAQVSKEAFSENFRERPWQFFEAVLQYLLTAYTQLWTQRANAQPAEIVEHLQVLLMDSTILRVANKLFSIFPARANRRCAQWAAVKLHLGFRLFRSVPEVITLAPHKINDHRIDFLRPAGEAVVYIFDLGYWTYALFDRIIEREQHFVSRLREDCNPPILAVTRGDSQWIGQRLKAIALTGPVLDLVVRLKGTHPTHPQMHHDVRLVGQWCDQDQTWHLYVTSLLDAHAYPAEVVMELYRLRWQIEILFRNLKCVLQIANFVSSTENGIRIQLYAALIHYVLTHLIILRATQVTGRPVEDFSVPYCLDAVQQVLQSTKALLLPGQEPNWDAVETQLVETVIRNGLRPNTKRKRLIEQVKTRLQPRTADSAPGP